MAIDPVTGAVMSDRATVEGWLDGLLMDSLMISEEHDEEAREFRYEAARALVEELAPEGVAERVIAVHFAAAQAAALEWQGRAVSRYLPEKTRETAQRFANSLYNIVKGQAATLSRLAETRRKAETQTRKEARDLKLRREWEETERQEAEDRVVPPPPGLAELYSSAPRDNGKAPSALDDGARTPTPGAVARPAAGSATANAIGSATGDFAARAGLAPGTDLDSLPRPQRRAALRRLKKLAKQNGPGP